MRAIPAARILKDYACPEASAPRPPGGTPAEHAEKDAALDLDKERLRQAFEEGLRQGRAEGEKALEQALAGLREAHAAEIREKEQAWKRQEASKLADSLRDGLLKLRHAMEEAVTDILAPVMTEAARRAAVDELAAMLEAMLAADGDLMLHAEGDEEMCRALRGGLGEFADRIELSKTSTSGKLIVHVDNTILETRVSEWAGKAFADDVS